MNPDPTNNSALHHDDQGSTPTQSPARADASYDPHSCLLPDDARELLPEMTPNSVSVIHQGDSASMIFSYPATTVKILGAENLTASAVAYLARTETAASRLAQTITRTGKSLDVPIVVVRDLDAGFAASPILSDFKSVIVLVESALSARGVATWMRQMSALMTSLNPLCEWRFVSMTHVLRDDDGPGHSHETGGRPKPGMMRRRLIPVQPLLPMDLLPCCAVTPDAA